MAGSTDLLKRLPQDRWAFDTSARRELAVNRMKAAGLPLPPVMVCAEDVAEGKSSPEGYLRAASLLGYPARDCVVFEDAAAGIRAGNASGARVVAVAPHTNGAQEAFACIPLTMLNIIPDGDGFRINSLTSQE